MRTVINDGFSNCHLLLIECILAFFAIYYKITSLAVVTNPLRSHIFVDEIVTYSCASVGTLTVLEEYITVVAFNWVIETIVLPF
jgi:hypothetical protein